MPKTHKCVKCGKAFQRHDNLRRHEEKHNMDKSYECNICRKVFMLKDNLRRHMKTHTTDFTDTKEEAKMSSNTNRTGDSVLTNEFIKDKISLTLKGQTYSKKFKTTVRNYVLKFNYSFDTDDLL